MRIRRPAVNGARLFEQGMAILRSIHNELAETFRANAVATWKMDRLVSRNIGKEDCCAQA